eukprot:7920924-Alexandrium_andersonii.AAC.1
MGSLEQAWPPTATVERPASWKVACHSADKTGPFQSPPRMTGGPLRAWSSPRRAGQRAEDWAAALR